MDRQITLPQVQIFNLSHKSDRLKHQQLLRSQKPHIIDTYTNQLIELCQIRYPKHKNDSDKHHQFVTSTIGSSNPDHLGNWVYYPWRNTLIHLLDKTEFFELRTARNLPLITKAQQQRFHDLTVAIIGLSVGNSIALSLIYSGGCNTIKLADPDTLELSNLNRVRATVLDLGTNKTHLTAKQIYEINPYAHISCFDQGVTPDNIESFLTKDPKPDLIIDECDHLTLKFNLRLIARSLKLPLLMVSDNGFESNIDLLRFDTNPKAGGMGDAPDISIKDLITSLQMSESLHLSPSEETQLIVQLVGANHISYGMQQAAFQYVNRQIAGWPQLAMTVFAGGSLASYITLLLANRSQTKAKTATFSFPQLLDPKHTSSRYQDQLHRHTQKFKYFLRRLSSI